MLLIKKALKGRRRLAACKCGNIINELKKTMKNIIKSLVIVMAVAAVASVATYAVFTATANIPGNSVATGTLTLAINHTAGKPYAVTNMYPGQVTNWEWMDVINTGTLFADYSFYLDSATASPDWNLWNNLKIELRSAGNASTEIGRCTATDSSPLYDGPVGNIYGFGNKILTKTHLNAGWAQRICQRVYLDSSVGNEAQGRSTGFTEVMYSEQSAAQ